MNFELAVSISFGFVLSHLLKRKRPYILFCDLLLFITEIFPIRTQRLFYPLQRPKFSSTGWIRLNVEIFSYWWHVSLLTCILLHSIILSLPSHSTLQFPFSVLPIPNNRYHHATLSLSRITSFEDRRSLYITHNLEALTHTPPPY